MGDVIEGTYETAICGGDDIPEDMRLYVRGLCNRSFMEGCRVRVMPGARLGRDGTPHGIAMVVRDGCAPSLMGTDPGCGMYGVCLGIEECDLPTLDEVCHAMPKGFDTWPRQRVDLSLRTLLCRNHLRDPERARLSAGTLGGGAHFVEVGAVDRPDGGRELWLLVHAGSRSLGTQVSGYYRRLAVRMHQRELDLRKERERLAEELALRGTRPELLRAIERLETSSEDPDAPANLCWLDGYALDDWVHDMDVCERVARLGRELIAQEVTGRCGFRVIDAFHSPHRFLRREPALDDALVLRAGATGAAKDEWSLVPLGVTAGCAMLKGAGNADWCLSGPAGVPRTYANDMSLDRYRRDMANVYSTCVGERTIDVSPAAYETPGDTIERTDETAEVVAITRTVYSFRAVR